MATNPPAPPAPPAPGAPPPPPPKKSRAMAFILGAVGGCLVLIIIVTVGIYFFVAHKAKQAGIDTDLMKRNPGMAAAKMMVAANPNIEMVSTDEGKSQVTVRDKKTGKTYTVSFEDAKNGKFTMTEEGKGTVTVGGKAKLPSWVPDYPGSETQGAFSATGPDGESGTFTFKTADPSDKVIKFYQDQFQSLGLKVTSNVTSQSGQSSAGMLVGEDQANKRTVTVVLGVEGSETTVGVTYATNK